jgi:hypothetical protein
VRLAVLLALAACSAEHRGAPRRSGEEGGALDGDPEREDGAPEAGTVAPLDAAAIQPPVQSYEDFCVQRARAECARLSECCGVEMRLDLCMASMRSYRWDRDLLPACTSQPSVATVDLALAQQCLDFGQRSYDGCQLLRSDAKPRQEAKRACTALFPEKLLPANGTCPYFPSTQRCESPAGTFSQCSACSDGCIGRCSAPRPLGKHGERCYQTVECAQGLICRQLSGTGSCEAPAVDGAPCNRDTDCASGSCPGEPGSTRSCAKLPPAIGGERCERARVLARDGLYRATPQFWLEGEYALWLDGGKLLRARADGSSTEPEPRATLPGQLRPELIVASAHDALHLWLLMVHSELWEVDLTLGTTRVLPMVGEALVSAQGSVWVAEPSCTRVTRITAGSVGDRWSRELDVMDVAASGRSVLAAVGDSVYCAAGNALWRAQAGQLVPVLRVPDHESGDAQSVSFAAVGLDSLFLFARTPGSRFALFKLATGTHALTRVALPDDVARSLNTGPALDPASGRAYAMDAAGLLRIDSSDASVARVSVPNGGYGGAVSVAGAFVYWYLDGVLYRHPLF